MQRLEDRFPQLWAFLERMGVIVIASLLFWLFSGLLVTLPAALAGLFAAVATLVRPGFGDTAVRFWRGFRRSLWPATALGILNLVVGLSVYLGFRIFWAMGSPAGKAAAFIYGSLAAVVAMANVFAWPLLTWYPQPLLPLLKRSLLLAAAHPLHALGALGAAFLAVLLFLLLPGPLLGLLPATGPGLVAAIISLIAWKAMKRYAGSDDEELE